MRKAPLPRLESALQSAGVSSSIRHELALKLYRNHATLDDITLLECKAMDSGADNPVGLFVSWIRGGDWKRIVEDIRSKAQQDREERERSGKGTSSSIRFVERSNPYGWSDPERMRGLDHADPGQWNSFRQCYNGQLERRADGSYDCRYYGSARPEVMGDAPGPTAEWDQSAVTQAKQFSEGASPLRAVPHPPSPTDNEPDPLEGIFGEE